jgi:predicted nuclease of predicted toxin-antitoxin system
MKRVLLDQGLAPDAAAALRESGWEAAHVSELGLERAEDAAIIHYAREHGMACITLDHDFHAHLAMASAGSPSVVLVRAEGLSALQQAALIQKVWEFCSSAIAEGAVVSTDGAAIRWRRLPLR